MPLIIGVERDRIMRRLVESGVILSGHFELHSGRHSDRYLDKRLFMQELVEEYDQFCALIADRIVTEGYSAIVAPEAAGMMVAERVLGHIRSRNYKVGYAPAYKTDNGFVIESNYKREIAGRCVAVIEDVITTGDTAVKAAQLARSMGASVNSVYCLFERGAHRRIGGIPIHPVVSIELQDWTPPCRLCEQGIPLSPKPMGGSQLALSD
jgi:orotate phosphoribosyltransferase